MRRGLSIAAGPRDTQDPVPKEERGDGDVPKPPQLPAPPPEQGVPAFSPALIPAHRPSFTNDATTRALSGRVLCSAPTAAAVIPTVAVIIPTVAPIGVDPNDA